MKFCAPCLFLLCIPVITNSLTQATFIPSIPNSGPIYGDMQCNVEDLEKANDAQLFEILNELKSTSFFKSFVVDLDQTCPLKKEASDQEIEVIPQKEEEVISCASEGIPDMDDDAGPACALKEDNPFATLGDRKSVV